MRAVHGIYPWCIALVRRSLDGEEFLGGLRIFFLGGRGRGRGLVRASTTESFSQETLGFKQSHFLCYILYIEQWGFRCSMRQTIANGSRSSMPWAACVVQVGTARRLLPRTEDSEGPVAPCSSTDSTEQWVWCLIHMWSMLHVISVICLV